MELLKYNLPDYSILNTKWNDYELYTWIPDGFYIVLGLSNKPESSIHLQAVQQDKITVYKRPSGGETVLITPNTLVISTLLSVAKLENPSRYFKNINQKIIDNLNIMGIHNLCQKGISDIAIGEKKILGSSIYRTMDKVFYHAVLNVREPISSIEKYLQYPSREPDYRHGRSHYDFVTSLVDQGYKYTPEQIGEIMINN
jgi:lipoate---protein ligase